ncbi:putative LRR receptor-like serine/threonine-protein kinase GSO2 [Heracleum sosnowskyi]|uniref:LRR receptor-like serine/threonine-protein kinase GSO2 n=1 Tax=Heracleum sosnowskyi TaxID=360622 RepID=A0AAD8N1S7_9APIA|nr:putative LRR receptor-like serine/threonine-protein kinase GSO2 [Heracleum sosnowskyi]
MIHKNAKTNLSRDFGFITFTIENVVDQVTRKEEPFHISSASKTVQSHDSIFYFSGSLVELDLCDNVLEGRIPESFGHMTALTSLNLENNHLTGPIPDSFALMTALTHLDLSANQLSCVLLKSIRDLSSLQVADFSSNNFTENLEDLLSGPFVVFQELLLYDNHLNGSLPDFSQLSSLKKLQVNSNQLNGRLPSVFECHSALHLLDLSNNHLRGSLPDFTGFSSLKVLSLYSNEFSGSLPDFTGCSSLKVLVLNENQLIEWETMSTGLLSNLEELDLSMNFIHNTITESHLSNLARLKYIRTSCWV